MVKVNVSFLGKTEDTETSEAWKNTAIILNHSTAYPFQVTGSSIRCCFCTLSFNDPTVFRKHVDSAHKNVDKSQPLNNKLNLRIDITDLQCISCVGVFDSLDSLSHHLNTEHKYDIKTVSNLKLVPMRLVMDKFVCMVCDKKFSTLNQLSRHSGSHYQRYVCEKCGKNFERDSALNYHVLLKHSNSEFFCRVCRKGFSSNLARRQHVEENKRCLPLACHICKERFLYWSPLENHLFDMHGIAKKTYPCKECGIQLDTRNKLYCHFRKEHTDELKCSDCVKRGDSLAAPMAIPKENAKLMLRHTTAYPFIQIERKYIGCCFCYSPFEDPTQFREHMDWEHHQIDKSTAVTEKFTTRVDIHDLRCKICKEGFPTLEPLSEHLISHHQIKIDSQHDLGLAPLKLEKERFFCYVCQKVFIAFYALFVHAISHLSRNICDACGKNFATQNGLDRHVLNSHTVRVDFPCKRCKQTFPSKEKRREHLAMSKSCLPIRCRQCHDRFTCKEMLEHHRVNVHGMTRRMHTCKLCGEVYHNRTLLYFHFKSTHTDDLRCQYCDRTFKVRSSLQEHVNSTHTGERPFKCPVCEKGLVSKKALAKHVIIHDDTKKVPCPVCGRLFVARWKLREHAKRHHPEIVI
ncbi:hypothetical protein JYU34_017920 [Plutella xylostella]|uniref:C2H2-type domain-containing protein n=1 Tax=Plutella xylostella TaxID=51655 RepID=A0ABQ7Q0Q1_PLUXY|nr:hypothetical protein JYU34_017920 [Plutella xylostella]